MCPKRVWACNFLIEIQFAKALKHSLLVEEILTFIDVVQPHEIEQNEINCGQQFEYIPLSVPQIWFCQSSWNWPSTDCQLKSQTLTKLSPSMPWKLTAKGVQTWHDQAPTIDSNIKFDNRRFHTVLAVSPHWVSNYFKCPSTHGFQLSEIFAWLCVFVSMTRVFAYGNSIPTYCTNPQYTKLWGCNHWGQKKYRLKTPSEPCNNMSMNHPVGCVTFIVWSTMNNPPSSPTCIFHHALIHKDS